ncbi:MAG TPA: site-2 protease family protein, partial [bacterium]|nr:site-2 protease family protein [bacterium]
MLEPGFWLMFAVRVPALLVALTVHEWAHAYTAMRKGDLTAYDAGRVSLNPFVHLDPIGSIGLLLGFFGWGRPVPVDHRLLKNPTRDSMWISFAGPLSNLTLAVAFGVIFRIWHLVAPPTEPVVLGEVEYLRVNLWQLSTL